ncbi:MFS general substrate transporter [Panaeolus papilionaceus]|nr:MFS general substrate transporter [Panaeolus papilionaceus]
MAFGILDDKYLEDVPGTAILTDLGYVHGQQVTIDEAANLKHGSGKHSHIVLVPQPSDDPNDPLNWPRWKKEACFWTLYALFFVAGGLINLRPMNRAFAASLDGALSPMVGPGYVLLSNQFGVSVDEVASSFGLLQNTLATKFGHRIVYLGSGKLKMFVACIWSAVSPNMTSIRASRAFQGFGMSALQSLVASTIEQIYFVHERGSRSVIWSFSILAGITFYVIQNLSWQMGFWFVTIPLGLCVLLIFFFVPETTYIRKPANSSLSSDKESRDKASLEGPQSDAESSVPMRKTYLSQLKIYNGTFTAASIFRLFMRPFPFLLSPVFWFLFLCFGMQTVWLSLMPLCSSTIFTIEYGFDATQIGLTNLGGIVGIVLATAFTGPLTDWGTVWLSKRNKGIYEPEFRIFFVGSMLFGVFGYAGWAVGTSHNMPWIGAVACIAMANFAIVVSGSAAVTYLLDTHGPNALHVLALSNFGKNMVLYGFTFFANGMIARRGVKVSLLILAGCQAACCIASVPMYIYGKRVRSLIARNPTLFRNGQEQ